MNELTTPAEGEKAADFFFVADSGRPTPRLVTGLREVLRGTRSGWAPGKVALTWIPVAILSLVLAILPAGGFRTLVVLALGLALLPLTALVVSAAAGWEFGCGGRWALSRSRTLIRMRARTVLLAILFILAVPFLFGLIPLVGGWLLGSIPGIGEFLASVWLVFPGIPMAVLAAAWLVIATPALLLTAPAAALDFPDLFDVVSRSVSYVRRRPLKFGLFVTGSVLGSLLVAFITGLFVFTVAATLIFSYLSAGKYPENPRDPATPGVYRTTMEIVCPVTSWSRAWEGEEAEAQTVPERPESTTPDSPVTPEKKPGEVAEKKTDGKTGAPTPEPEKPPEPFAGAEDLPLLLRGSLVAMSWLIPASFIAALLACLTRLYLLLRWEIDRESPRALLHPDEKFNWQ